MTSALSQITGENTIPLSEESSQALVNSLPSEILQLIFSWLTNKEAFIASRVCIYWKKQLELTPPLKNAFTRRFDLIKICHTLQNELKSDSAFHLSPICALGRSHKPSFASVTESGFISIKEPTGDEYGIFTKNLGDPSEYLFVGSFENKGFFLDDITRMELAIFDLEIGIEGATIDVYNVPNSQETDKKPTKEHFNIVKCFVLPSKEIIVVTEGGIIQIWDGSDETPKLKVYKECFPDAIAPNTVIAASLFGSHAILICPDLENAFYDFDIKTNSLAVIECAQKIPPSLRRKIFFETIGDRCIVQIAENLLCFKDKGKKVELQWVKREFNLILQPSTLRHQSGLYFAASPSLTEGTLEKIVLFDPENGNEIFNLQEDTRKFPTLCRNYCITFYDQKIFFKSLAGKPLGDSNGYSLVFPEQLKLVKFELTDIAITQNRMLLLAEIDEGKGTKHAIFEVLSRHEKIEGVAEDVAEEEEETLSAESPATESLLESSDPDPELYVFSETDPGEEPVFEYTFSDAYPEEDDALKDVGQSIEAPQAEKSDMPILPIAPYAKKLEPRGQNIGEENHLEEPLWEIARIATILVLALLSGLLLIGTCLTSAYGMVNLSWGLAAGTFATFIGVGLACYCKG